MSTPPKPLCRKTFLANTIIDMDGLLKEITHSERKDVGSIHATRSIKDLQSEDLTFFSNEIWRMASEFWGLALDRRANWDHWWQLKNSVNDKPNLGSMVFVQDAIRYQKRDNAVGQLIRIEQEPRRGYGGVRVYEDDGGPARISEQYVLKILDGSEFTWYNASIAFVPTHRTIQMHRKIIREHAAAPA
jgi:hypothetical protein